MRSSSPAKIQQPHLTCGAAEFHPTLNARPTGYARSSGPPGPRLITRSADGRRYATAHYQPVRQAQLSFQETEHEELVQGYMEVPHITGQLHRHQNLQVAMRDRGVLRQLAPAGIGNDRHLGKGAESTVQAAQVHIGLAASFLYVSFRFWAQREAYGTAFWQLRCSLPPILPPSYA